MDANTVGAVGALTGVSVRTLHHYDHIGLAVPGVRTPAGYREYTDADIERLHLVLVYRSVGMPLNDIRALLDDSSADVLGHLRRQHGLLLEQAERLQHTIKAVEELMNAHRQGIQLTAEEQVELFGTTAFGDEYAAEAEERWGETDAWKQSQQRVSQFSKQDWGAIKAEGGRAAQGAGAGHTRLRRTRLCASQRAGVPAPRVDRAVLRLRRRDAPQSGGDVFGRRTVHPVLRRRRARAGPVPAQHRRG
jgi:DNA-binding transcriptional MerR regulator